MMRWSRKIIIYAQQPEKQRLLYIIFIFILVYFINSILSNAIIIESQNVLSALGSIYANSFNDLDKNYVVSILGTLAQSNATILAIVMSLGLVVIEFSASKYPAKVVDFIEHDPIMWIFLIIYGLSIFYPVCLTALVNDNTNNSNLKFYFSTTYALSIIAYISLSYYIHYVFKMLKSNSIIYILSKKIDKKRLLDSSVKIGEYESNISKGEPRINRIVISIDGEKDPLLPIIDIIQASSLRHDYNTVEYGLEAITNRLLNILMLNPTVEKRMSGYVFNHIFEIWKLALRNKDFKLINMILVQYYDIGEKCTVPMRMPDFSDDDSLMKRMQKFLIPLCNVVSISSTEEKIIQDNLLYTTFLSEYYLKEAFKSIVDMKEEEVQNLSLELTKYVHELGKLTFINQIELTMDKPVEVSESLEGSISELSYILSDIGIVAINAGLKYAFEVVINTLNDIGNAAIHYNLIHSIFHIVESLQIIGEESAKKGEGFEPLTKQIVERLEKLASKIDSHSKTLSDETRNQVIEYHEYIKENYDYENKGYAFEELSDGVELIIRAYISSYVYTIGLESVRNNLLDATRQCLKSLEFIERILKNGTNSRHIGENIRYLGLEAVKKEQTYPLMEDIVKSLYSIGMLQFGYMFDWEEDLEKGKEFLKKEHIDYLAKGSQLNYSDFEETVDFKDMGDSSYSVYLDDTIYKEKILTIDNKERKNIKCLYLSDIEDACFKDNTLKLFKVGVFKNSEKAYYKVPELLKELTTPILEYALKSPSDKTIKPFTMIIQCLENFGIVSIHFRDEFSLNKIFIRSLIAIGDSLVYKSRHSEDSKDPKVSEYLDWAVTVTSNSLYNLAVLSLKCNLVDYDTLYRQMECLIRIQKEYPYSLHNAVYKFETIIEMIKESELAESECDKIIETIENAIEELKEQKSG